MIIFDIYLSVRKNVSLKHVNKRIPETFETILSPTYIIKYFEDETLNLYTTVKTQTEKQSISQYPYINSTNKTEMCSMTIDYTSIIPLYY